MPPNFDPYNLMGGFQAKNTQRQSQADTLRAATRSGTIKNLLAQKKAAVDKAVAKQGNLDKLAQIGLQYNQQMPEYAKHMYGKQENQRLRALQLSKVIENLGKGISPVAAETGIQPTQAGYTQMLQGSLPHLGQLITKPPTRVLSSAAGAGLSRETGQKESTEGITIGSGKTAQPGLVKKIRVETSAKQKAKGSNPQAINNTLRALQGGQATVIKDPAYHAGVPGKIVQSKDGSLEFIGNDNSTYLKIDPTGLRKKN